VGLGVVRPSRFQVSILYLRSRQRCMHRTWSSLGRFCTKALCVMKCVNCAPCCGAQPIVERVGIVYNLVRWRTVLVLSVPQDMVGRAWTCSVGPLCLGTTFRMYE
jgi:hypothetical protein